MSTREKARLRVLKRLRRLLRETEQLRNDLDWWNENRTEHPPFDCEGEKVAIPMLKEMIALVEADENIPPALWQRYMAQADANAKGRDE